MAEGPIHLEVRATRIGERRQPTRTEVRNVLIDVAETGQVPAGWAIAAIDWRHPRRTGEGGGAWRTGRVSDLQAFAALLVGERENIRVGVQEMEGARRQLAPADVESWERYRLKAGESSGKYRPGQFVPVSYARRYPGKVVGDYAPPEELPEIDVEYEVLVTVDY